MSRSILKSSDSKRLIPIPANEGYANDADYDSLNKVKPWSSVDEEPLMMRDIQNEMSNIHQNLAQMHEKMMGNFPQPPNVPMEPMMPLGPLPPLVPPPFPQPVMPNMLMPGPGPHGNIQHRNGSPNPGQMLAIRESGSPCGSLDRRSHHRGMQMAMPGQHPGGFGQGDIMIHAPPRMSPMPIAPPLPAPPGPVFTEDDYGNQIMELVLDVKGFMPEDIHIHTEHNVLHVHARRLSAKHDVTGKGVEDARVAKDCRRQYTLPDVVRAENLRCFVNRKGQLTIEGPLGAEIIQRTNRKKVKFVPGNKLTS